MDAMLDSTELSRNELAVQVVRSFGELHLRVTGSSMLPAIRPEDVLVVRRCGIEAVEVGDVVLAVRQRRLFAHRVIAHSGAWLVTQGDGIADPDPPVSASEFLGKVTNVLRGGKSVRTAASSAFSRRLATMLFRRSPGAGRLFTRLHSLQTRALQ
jgi:signal peptidase